MTDATSDLERLRFPIGRVAYRSDLGAADRVLLIDRIAALPARVRAVVEPMSDRALDTPYRPGGWTARQVVHHLPDSHVNAYIRFRMAATEQDPPIKVYQVAEWARLADSAGPVAPSLALLDALHVRWTAWLRMLDEDAWKRAYVHPENGRVPLDRALQLYAWHGDHHLGHLRAVAESSAR